MKVRLPPLQALRHFEGAARLGSFKAAAEELNVTQGAVSQQIRELERFLATKLFVRQVRKVTLTDEGRQLSQVVSASFSDIAVVCRQISSTRDDGRVRIELGTFFSSRWLSPRIGRFMAQQPSVHPELVHCIDVKPQEADVDVAIQYGSGVWRSFEARKLMNLSMQPVGKPGSAFPSEEEWREGSPPLLHARSREDWENWLRSADLPVEWAQNGIVLTDTNVALEAAASGAGIAMGYFPLIEEDVSSGRLSTLHLHRMTASNAYYVLVRPGSKSIRAVQRFVNWIDDECREFR